MFFRASHVFAFVHVFNLLLPFFDKRMNESLKIRILLKRNYYKKHNEIVTEYQILKDISKYKKIIATKMKLKKIQIIVYLPVEPNPPAPRSVSFNVSNSTNFGKQIRSHINCAIRSPRV